MIQLKSLTKYYPSELGRQYVFKNVDFTIPGNTNIAILGKNGAGKSTLFRLIAGSEYPDSGKIVTRKNLSWPIALASGLHNEMTGRQNARFIARVNGVADIDAFERKVLRFSELKSKFDLPVKTYSSGMRTRLSFSCVISINFDYYLIDEAISVADPAFKQKAHQAMTDKAKSSNIILVTHELDEARELCDSAVVMHHGKLSYYPKLEQGIAVYERL